MFFGDKLAIVKNVECGQIIRRFQSFNELLLNLSF